MKIFALFLLPIALFSNFFEDRLPNAKNGDFVVYENNKNSSMLVINQIDDEKIILEEISFPSYLKNTIKDPKKWLENKAPGNTSWRIYELSRKTLELKEAYSYTQASHLLLNDQNFFLSKFFALNLTKVSDTHRRKKGTPPKKKPDTRAYWDPPVYINGIKQKKSTTAFSAKWPEDGSKLANEKISMYFAENIFFPLWIEIEASRVIHPFKVTNSGNRDFIKKNLPQRRPYFTKKPYLTKDCVITELSVPKSLQPFDLVAVDATKVNSSILSISYKAEIKGEKVTIYLDTKNLSKGHLHRLILLPKNGSSISCETTFTL